MTRLALTLLLLGSFASAQRAAPAAGAFPTETAIRAQASASVEELCKKAKGECDNARAILEGYRSLLAEATACEGGRGDAGRVSKVARALVGFDEREALLPRFPGTDGRPLLRLSALISARLSAAAVRLGKPAAANAPTWNPDVEAPKVVETICLDEPAACGEFRGLLSEDQNLFPPVTDCITKACPFEAADALVVRADRQMSRYFAASSPLKTKSLQVFSLVNRTRDASVKALASTLERTLRDLNAKTDGLSARVDRAQLPGSGGDADLAALPADGTALQETYRQATFGADRLAHVLGYEKASAQRDAVNAATGRISGLRARALALMTARGLKDSQADALGVSAAQPGPAAAKAGPALSPAKAPTLLDRRAVPVPGDASAPAPQILPGNPAWLTLIENYNAKDPSVRADALRRLGRTKTLGNPSLYAAQAYTQESPSGCAVAAQVEVLKAHKLLPAGDPIAQERELIAEGTRRGLYSNGTMPEYSADLLVAHGMLVRRQLKATWFDFEKALRTGHPLQVGVDARFIWNMKGSEKLPHSILVTGAEVSKSDGEILGVYINDSGTEPPGAGKFVPRETFRKAWVGSYAEIQ